MKKHLILLAAVCFVLSPAGARAAELAFTRWEGKGGHYVWHFDTETKKETRCVQGYDPEIAPAGKIIAYTRYDEKGGRRIAVCQVEGKKIKDVTSGYMVKNTKKGPFAPNDYGPRWSADGRRLLFSRFINGERWTPVILSLKPGDGGQPAEFLPAPQSGAHAADLFSPFWSADAKSVFASDLKEIYRFSARRGAPPKLEERIAFRQILSSDDILVDSAIKFSVSPDGTRWLFTAEAGGKRCAFCTATKSPAETKGAVFIYRPKTGATEQVDTGGLCAADAAWLGDGEVVFSAHSPAEKKSRVKSANLYDVYRLTLDGGKPRKIIANGQNVSAAR